MYTLEALWFVKSYVFYFLRMDEDIQKRVIQSVFLGKGERWSVFWDSLSKKQYFSGKIITLFVSEK